MALTQIPPEEVLHEHAVVVAMLIIFKLCFCLFTIVYFYL